ncbi:polysaccharide deacetylase family protein [Gilvimarinus sp. DA14]|uniref:polysaccharide deacetylase family protein n=1 Tax=Gilvimarinus sp. DA14 TaxID=2956798 RepID=UPI0020B7FBD7|nr:polysaccharide deacetylase family protein [Gilvimarinus sp. DA14]UTF61642.1 polysaccharide deacetylase family protein [Gilvimarinus sp. DA14]
MRVHLLLLVLGMLLGCGARAAVILQYHHISETTPAATSTKPELFAQHLEYLDKRNFTVLALPELLKRLRNGEALNEKVAAITFDDGYDSVFRTALPLLKKYDYPFTVFVNSALVGSSGYASWEQLKLMQDSGATIANHTATHPHMVRLEKGETQKQWRERMRDEIESSQQIIEEALGGSEKYLAYPYGEYSAPLLALVEGMGYVGFAQHSGAVGPDSDFLALPRFPMGSSYGNMDTFPDKVMSQPLPLANRILRDDSNNKLDEPIVRGGSRPMLELELENDSLAARVQCFWNGKPMEVMRDRAIISVRSDAGLKPGRSRYNCTASISGSDRFFWFSQPWFVTDSNGDWQHTD